MTQSNDPETRTFSAGDLISLADAEGTPVGPNAPVSAQDSILNTANAFEVQLEQMSAWKHQLAQQMEIMRRDGIKLLERQKSLAVERKRLSDERDSLVADREHVEKLHLEVAEENKRLRDKEAQIEAARSDLEKLETERQRWARDLAVAQQALQGLEQRRIQTESQLDAAEARIAEIQTLANQRDSLIAQVSAARQTAADLEKEIANANASRQAFQQREAELSSRERALADQEARHLTETVSLREAIEQIEQQRKALAESQRALLHERDAHGAKVQERLTVLEARTAELAKLETQLAAKVSETAAREKQLRTEKLNIENAQAQLLAHQEELIQAERSLAQRKLGVDDELQQRLAAAEKAKADLEAERQSLIQQRQALEKKLDAMETELSSQLDMLAKQTKRLTERRADLETRSAELEKEYETRLARETESLREELARAHRTYEQRATFLQQQIDEQASARDWAEREAVLRSELDASGEQLVAAKADLARISTELADSERNRAQQSVALTEQVARYETLAAAWQNLVDEAEAAKRSNQEIKADSQADAAALATLQSKLDQALAALKGAEEKRKILERELAGAHAAGSQQVDDLAKQVQMFEQQRDDLANQLFTVQDILRRQTDDSLLAKNSLEGELHSLRRRTAELEAERKTWQSQQADLSAQISPEEIAQVRQAQTQVLQAQEALGVQRERLLQQARNLRAYRNQVHETNGTLEANRDELAQQREQLRSRKENLEQVKRLLEKQELVMARKLADHNALKTVAAVGIFVIMVLGSVFISVYKFVNPIYRSEAVVQLVPPTATPLQGVELQAWLTRQMEFVRSDDVTFTAWKMLRSADERYGMHDVREDWVASLGKKLSLQLDPGTKTLAIRYTGPNAEGVSQVCNALAMAYATPAAREGTPDQDRTFGAGATVLAKAVAPLYPTEDNRMMLSLSFVAVVMFVSLVLVVIFRHYVARQLREIDQMADDQDLDDIRVEMPANPRPA